MKNPKKSIYMFVFLVFSVMPLSRVAPLEGKELTAQQMLELSKPAVVFVEHFYSGWVQYKGKMYGSIVDPSQPFFESFFGEIQAGPFREGGGASGFLVHPDGYILTAGHCVQDYLDVARMLVLYAFVRDYKIPVFIQQVGREPNPDEIKNLYDNVILEGATVVDLKKQIWVRTGNWSAYKADVLVVSEMREGKDVAIIKITGQNFPTLPLGDSNVVKNADPLWVIGFPGILQDQTGRTLNVKEIFNPTVTQGIVSAIRTDETGAPVFQIDATISGGNSGGPAINSNGEVIGIASWGPMSADTHYTGSQYGMFVPINQAKVFINQAGFTPQRGLTDRLFRQAMDYFWDEKWEKSLAEFKKVQEFYPGHPATTDFIRQCNEKIIGPEKEGFVFPGWLKWLLIIIAALVVIGVVIFLLSKVSLPKPAKKKVKLGYLQVQAGPLAGNRFNIEKSGIRIGRDAAQCQIVLTEETASREHTLVEPTAEGKIRVRNLSATNPSYVNERPITEAEIKDGDQIRVGKTILVYKSEE